MESTCRARQERATFLVGHLGAPINPKATSHQSWRKAADSARSIALSCMNLLQGGPKTKKGFIDMATEYASAARLSS